MTRKEAINNIMPIKDLMNEKGWHSDFIESLDMAINALKVDVKAMREEIENEKIDFDLDIGQEKYYNQAIDDVLAIIDKYMGVKE